MHHLWRHQRVCREEMATVEGVPLRVLHPGFWNRSAGPDFKGALVQFGDAVPVSGDVEIDGRVTMWGSHRHAGNPAYRQVVLHVVWEEEVPVAGVPTMGLRRWLDAPLAELVPWLLGEAPGLIPANVRGGCSGPLSRLPGEAVETLLESAARHRLLRKASEFQARARHVGWDRALWEGLLGGLGYRHNTWPFRRIAELVHPHSAESGWDVATLQACLLGLGGFLPVDTGAGRPAYVRELWDRWWRERDRFVPSILPPGAWRLGGLRPANHPQRRLALAGHWTARRGLASEVAGAVLGAEPRRAAEELARVLEPGSDPFWESHWTLGGHAGPAGPLLGQARATDLAVNVVLPWLRARSALSSDPAAVERVEERYFAWPAGEDNAVLRLARQRLGGGERRKWPRRAAIQQGLLQVADDFCSAVDSLCNGCGFPGLVAAWPPAGNGITCRTERSCRPGG